jgi:hypothetical protein
MSTIRGALAAATSDNIQAVAILACQSFGTTLAICDETTLKVETTILPTPQPALIKFLGAAVGYSADDCAIQLGGSKEGLRFLGLAAPLVTTLDLFEGARALDIMLRNSNSDLKPFPTLRQLKDLLASLEARCCCCGFADSVVGWQIILREKAIPHMITHGNHHEHVESRPADWEYTLLQSAPSPEMVDKLVESFRQLARVGESAIVGITIKARAAVPWIVAFTKWCLKFPPSIYLGDMQQILSEPSSQVRVIIPITAKDIGNDLEITIHDGIDHLNQLVAASSTKLLRGMVSVEMYGEWLLQELGFRDTSLRALHQAIEYAIPEIIGSIKYADSNITSYPTAVGRLNLEVDNSADGSNISPLPCIRSIATAYCQLLNTERPPRFASLAAGLTISDLPHVSQQLELLEQRCQCSACQSIPQLHASSKRTICKKEFFFDYMSFIITDILTLSLFTSPTPLLVKLSDDRESGNSLERRISRFLRTGTKIVEVPALQSFHSSLLMWARDMVGHKVDASDEEGDTVVTSGNGQVIYPAIFDSFNIERQGYMKISSYPGTLRYGGDIYRVVTGDKSSIAADEVIMPDMPSAAEVQLPLNLFPGLEAFWKVGIQDNSQLCVKLALRSKRRRLLAVELHPMDLLYALKDVLLLERCPHDSRAEVTPADRFCSFTDFLVDHEEACSSPSYVNVIAVDRADDLRFFALGCAGVPIVLRKYACIACCLDLCREAGIHVLVL